MALFGALSFLAPLPTLNVLWASIMQFYVIEEWVHHSVHYLSHYGLGGPYWTYINRHHMRSARRRRGEEKIAAGLAP
jgi:hypothetical protein